MNKFIFYLLLMFTACSSYSADYYSDFYSKFHNSMKKFTKPSNMFVDDFRNPKEVNLPWENALVRIPIGEANIYKTTIKNINDKKFPKQKYKTIIYLHGCAGIWKGTVKRMDFFAKNGFAVIAPASMAREKYARSCNTDTNQGGLYRSVLKIRQIDAENAILNAKKLGWVDDKNIFLVGLSEGGITTATYHPKNSRLGVSGRIIEGWTCNAGWDEYRGVNSPYNEPILSIVAKYDPWFQADYLKGHCGQFLNKNSFSKSIIIDEDPILSKQHGVLHDPKIKKIAIDFLNSIIK